MINPVVRELQKIQLIDSQIMLMQSEIDRLRELATGTTPTYGSKVVSSTHNQDKMGASVAAIVDLEHTIADLSAERKRYLALLRRIPEVVDNPLEAKSQMDVLYGRYFAHKTVLEVAREIRCSERNVYSVHCRALHSYGELLKEDAKK